VAHVISLPHKPLHVLLKAGRRGEGALYTHSKLGSRQAHSYLVHHVRYTDQVTFGELMKAI
jgi:hypothetical protein